MTDIWLPDWLRQARTRFRYHANRGFSRGTFSGVAKIASLGGDRVSCGIEFTPHGGPTSDGAIERAVLRAQGFQAASAGGVWATDVSHVRRGSYAVSELFANNTFNGTTGWQAVSNSTLSATDRVARSTISAVTVGNALGFGPSSAVTVTQYAPHALRALRSLGRGAVAAQMYMAVGSTLAGTDYVPAVLQSDGLATLAFTPYTTTVIPFIGEVVASGNLPGDYFSCPYVSLARCPLVDNAPNLLLQSASIDNASWTKSGCTVTANNRTAPDGAATGDSLVEDTSTGTHFVSQAVTVASSVADYCFGAALRIVGRDFAALQMIEATGSTAAIAYFNISGGTVGTVSSSTNWSNHRAFIVPLGGSWYGCFLVARKTNAATSVVGRIYAAEADNDINYTGDGASGVSIWRATISQSSVPSRLALTTSAATTGTSQPGSALYLKGLPASTSGLLLPGDWFEVITPTYSSLHMVTMDGTLNSDAAGLGYMKFSPPLRSSPADGAAVIVENPMGRFFVTEDFIEFLNEPGRISTMGLELDEVGA